MFNFLISSSPNHAIGETEEQFWRGFYAASKNLDIDENETIAFKAGRAHHLRGGRIPGRVYCDLPELF